MRIARVLPQKKAQSYSAGQPGSIEIFVSNAIVCLARFRSHGMCDLSPIPYLGCSVHMPAPQLQSAHSPPSPTPAPAPQRLAIASVAHSAYRDHYESAGGKLGNVSSIWATELGCLSWAISRHLSSFLGCHLSSEPVKLAPCKHLSQLYIPTSLHTCCLLLSSSPSTRPRHRVRSSRWSVASIASALWRACSAWRMRWGAHSGEGERVGEGGT